MTYDLFPRQAAAEQALRSGSFALFWEQRLGKTRAVLHAFDRDWQDGGPRNLVVVCPEIAKQVWRREAQEMNLGLPIQVGYGRSRPQVKPAGDWPLPRVLVVNWDILEGHEAAIRDLRPFWLVLDETHEHATNPLTKRWKAARRLSVLAQRVTILTGTPYKNHATDIFWQLFLLGRANPFHGWSVDSFAERYCLKRWNPFGGRMTGSKYASGRIARQGAWEYTRLKDERDLLERCQGVVDRRTEASEGAALPQADLPVWVDEGSHSYEGGDGGMEIARVELIPLKVKRTIQFVESAPWRPLVVVGYHREFLRQVGEHFKAPVIDGSTSSAQRLQIQDAFARGEHPILVGQMEAMGMSIDLSTAGHMVFGEIDWSESAIRQCRARIRGPRQRRAMVAYSYLLVSNSVDEYVWTTKLGKGRDMDRFDSAAKEAGYAV